jgi:predicted dehydrogenase
MTIRTGLIGAGSLGQAHLASLATFEDVQVAAVCDNDRGLAEHVAAPFGASVHINFRTLIEDERLDAVFVCLPPFAMGEPEIHAARAGVNLFVAPPVALNIQKAREVGKEIESSGIIASVGYTWRYLSGTDLLKEMLESRMTALMWAWRFMSVPEPGWRHRREASGGLFLQACTGLIDTARYLLGEVAHVGAMDCQGLNAPAFDGYDIEDACAVLLGFRGGAAGQIVCSDLSPWEDEAGLGVMADGFHGELTAEKVSVSEPGKEMAVEHVAPGLREAHAAFFKAVRTGDAKPVRSPYGDAVATLEVALAVRRSIDEQKMVTL